ncbi:MAG TPA: hypothetical protein VM532_04300, partial [Burkholderiales bacterium]|nr:hypothetical protein [Burkholderiales bacterium]
MLSETPASPIRTPPLLGSKPDRSLRLCDTFLKAEVGYWNHDRIRLFRLTLFPSRVPMFSAKNTIATEDAELWQAIEAERVR